MKEDMEFSVRTTSTGKYLFEQVISTIGMREMWFFGLQFEDDEGHMTWLNLNKTIVSQHIKEQTVSKGSKHRIEVIYFNLFNSDLEDVVTDVDGVKILVTGMTTFVVKTSTFYEIIKGTSSDSESSFTQKMHQLS